MILTTLYTADTGALCKLPLFSEGCLRVPCLRVPCMATPPTSAPARSLRPAAAQLTASRMESSITGLADLPGKAVGTWTHCEFGGAGVRAGMCEERAATGSGQQLRRLPCSQVP